MLVLPLPSQWQYRIVFLIVDRVYLPLWLVAWNTIIFWHAMDDEKIEEGDFDFYEAVWFHCKEINYRSGESCKMTYEILQGQNKRVCIWCSLILKRLAIGCFEKYVGIVEERIIYLFIMFIEDMYERAETKDWDVRKRPKGPPC